MPSPTNTSPPAAQKGEKAEPVVIAFATQKGGVGKSTIAMLFASYLYYERGAQVLVIDADPQQTVKRTRDIESRRLAEDPQYVTAARAGGRERAYPIAVAPTGGVVEGIDGKPSLLEKAKAFGADYVVIDTPGSVVGKGYLSLLRRADHIVVPLEPEEMSLRATVEFLGALQTLLPELPPERIITFWNKVRLRYHAADLAQQSFYFVDAGHRMLAEYVPFSIKMNRDDTRSTVQRLDLRVLRLQPFLDELANAVAASTETV